MKVLEKEVVNGMLKSFDTPEGLEFLRAEVIGRDDVLYCFKDDKGHMYILLCRDYIGTKSMENRILEKEQGLKVKEWYEVKGEETWYGDEEADRENYVVKYASDEGYPYSFALLCLK